MDKGCLWMDNRCIGDLVIRHPYVILRNKCFSSYDFVWGDALLEGRFALPDMVVSG